MKQEIKITEKPRYIVEAENKQNAQEDRERNSRAEQLLEEESESL